MENVVLAEEFARAKAPLRADFFGDTLVGPTILQWGTEEQKKDFLPKILNGEMAWCQGFSEPNSGSDLASLKTTAVLDGDEWVITGQKVWTTQAQFADYCFLLARTDPDATKHKGISYLLVPMKQDGIEVRGITQPDGTAEFNEVFFDGARCPIDNVVGGINNGWMVANTTLSHERGIVGDHRLPALRAGARPDGRRRPRPTGGSTTRSSARASPATTRRSRSSGSTGCASLTATAPRTRRTRPSPRSAPPTRCSGPRCTATRWSWRSTSSEPTSMLADTQPEGGGWPAAARSQGRDGYPVSPMMSAFFFCRSETIWGGTAEIQRNIVGERVLGLPREPKPTSS